MPLLAWVTLAVWLIALLGERRRLSSGTGSDRLLALLHAVLAGVVGIVLYLVLGAVYLGGFALFMGSVALALLLLLLYHNRPGPLRRLPPLLGHPAPRVV